MATKNDLHQPATKGDLRELREELRKEIKNGDNKLSKKIDGVDKRLSKKIEGLDERLSGQIKDLDERLSGQIEDLDERLSGQIKDVKEALSNQTDNLTTQIDGLAKLIKDQTEEFRVHNLTHQRQDDRLDDHEKRISRLENATS